MTLLTPTLALEPTKVDDTTHEHDDHHDSSNDEQLQTQQSPSLKPDHLPCQSNEAMKKMKTPSSETFQAVNEEVGTKAEGLAAEDNGRERLKRHRIEVAGRVWIPDIWGQEEMLKDWIDCSAFDASLVSSNIMSARAALAQAGRRPTSARLRIENRC